jgi:DNA ligase-1
MKRVIELFEKIKNTSGSNDKKEIIAANKDNELFKKCLVFLLDGNLVTGISDKKIKKDIWISDYLLKLDTFGDVIDYLKDNNTGTDKNVLTVQMFINSQPEEYREFYSEMVTKKYRLGVDAKTVNKIIPGLIPVFDVMLGTSVERVKLNGNERIFISRKLNGTRASFVGNKMMTRQGKEYNGLNHIIVDLQKLVGTETFVDGELVYKNKEGLSDSQAFQLGTGLAMSKSDDKSDLKLVIFDVFTLKEFWSGKSKETYSERYNRLNELRNEIVLYGLEENIEVVEMFYDGYDHSEIWKWLDYAENMDYEGCIVNLDACYECKRTKNLLKVKKFKEIDLRCTGVNIATSGKYKGILGSVTCKYEDGFVDVGSGFDDSDRKYYTDHPEEIVGKVISIKFKEETTNKNGGKSLQFPVFIACRDVSDKNFADDEV